MKICIYHKNNKPKTKKNNRNYNCGLLELEEIMILEVGKTVKFLRETY